MDGADPPALALCRARGAGARAPKPPLTARELSQQLHQAAGHRPRHRGDRQRRARLRRRSSSSRRAACGARAARRGTRRSRRGPGRTLETEPSIDDVVLRYLGAFGPGDGHGRAELVGPDEAHGRSSSACGRSSRRSATSDGRELFDLPDAPRPDGRRARPRSGSSASTTTSCSATPTAAGSSPPTSRGRRCSPTAASSTTCSSTGCCAPPGGSDEAATLAIRLVRSADAPRSATRSRPRRSGSSGCSASRGTSGSSHRPD